MKTVIDIWLPRLTPVLLDQLHRGQFFVVHEVLCEKYDVGSDASWEIVRDLAAHLKIPGFYL